MGIPTVAQQVWDVTLFQWWLGSLLRQGFNPQTGIVGKGSSIAVSVAWIQSLAQ